jgi:hypothetical protein
MEPGTIETELLKLEKQYWQALKARDEDAVVKLTDFPCLIAGARGVLSIDQKALMGMMKSMASELRSFDLSDTHVRLLGAEVGIVTYKVHEELTVDGKPMTLDAADASTWVKREGTWRCALHAEAISGDPYGRDRNPDAADQR